MKDLYAAAKSFKSIDVNRNSTFCHSMDKESYKIQCKNFFKDSKNKELFVKLAEESTVDCNNSEKLFTMWLNVEWYD